MERLVDFLPSWVWATIAILGMGRELLRSHKWLWNLMKWFWGRAWPQKRVKVLGLSRQREETLRDAFLRSSGYGTPVPFYEVTVATLDKPVMIHTLSVITLDGKRYPARLEGLKGILTEDLNVRIQASDKYVFVVGEDLITTPIACIRLEFQDGVVLQVRPNGFTHYALGRLRYAKRSRPP